MSVLVSIVKGHGAARLTFADGETRVVPLPLYRERTLRIGQDIELPEYDAFLRLRAYPHALDAAVKLLTLRARAEGEIISSLHRKHYDDDAIASVLATLRKQRLLNDADFAVQWAESRGRKLGKTRVARELARKGVDRDTVQNSLLAIDDEAQLEVAAYLVRKSLAGASDPAALRRAYSALARRGYEPDIIRKALKTAQIESIPDE